MKQLAKIIVVILVCMLPLGCCTEDHTNIQKNTSEVILNLRTNGYHEYQSKLNDVVLAELNSWEGNLIDTEVIEKISELAAMVKLEKSSDEIYVIEWDDTENENLKNTITLEWNPEIGVVIRIFTLSEKIIEVLPAQSYS